MKIKPREWRQLTYMEQIVTLEYAVSENVMKWIKRQQIKKAAI